MFVILSTQRSGSSNLVSMLDSHPEIDCRSELFILKRKPEGTYLRYRTASLSRRLRHVVSQKALIDEYLASQRGDKLFGFKLMYGQLAKLPNVWKCIDGKVVHLVRDNLLRAHVSYLIAKNRGYFGSIAEKPEPVWIDTRTLIDQLHQSADVIERHRKLVVDRDHIEVHYETLDPLVITRFLGVRDAPMTSRFFKSDYHLSELISNFEQVAGCLKGTRYERHLT